MSEMQPTWLPAAVPLADGVPDPCRRFVPVAAVSLDGATGAAGAACVPEAFTNVTQECSQWVYPNKELSIMTEVRVRMAKLYANFHRPLVTAVSLVVEQVGLPTHRRSGAGPASYSANRFFTRRLYPRPAAQRPQLAIGFVDAIFALAPRCPRTF